MSLALFNDAAATLVVIFSRVLAGFLAGCAVFTILSLIPRQACNPGRPWWRSRSLRADLAYMAVTPLIAPALRAIPFFLIAAVMSAATSVEATYNYVQNGRGPLSALPFHLQFLSYFILFDFLSYWTHRLFHRRALWPFHMAHHSAQDVDWTTGYRMHPVNFLLGSYAINALMIFLGAPLATIALFAPLDVAWSYFVHANLNWTLGPLRYAIATPVFHRWHHTAASEGGEANFAAFLAIWDVLFGTFHMPRNALPENYGVADKAFPQGFAGQIVYPFRGWARLFRLGRRGASDKPKA